MRLKLNINVFLVYLLAGILGVIGSFFVLHLLHDLEIPNSTNHTLLYYLDEHLPRSHALTIIFVFIFASLITANRGLVGEDIKIQEAKIESLEEANQTKTEFISFVSHEIRNPLAGIKWTIKMLLDGEFGRLNSQQKEILSQAFRKNEDVELFVQDFLDISKIESRRLEVVLKPIELSELEKEIRGIAAKFKSLPGNKGNQEIAIEADMGHKLSLAVDLRRIIQVVENLLKNAVNYTAENGKIIIAMGKDGDNFKFTISDTGCGIPKDAQPRIFQKFFRAKNARRISSSGTGLGLYLCKQFIEAHDGKIWFSSEAEKGTTFIFTLPFKQKAETEEVFRKI